MEFSFCVKEIFYQKLYIDKEKYFNYKQIS